MKTEALASPADAAPIVQLADVESADVPRGRRRRRAGGRRAAARARVRRAAAGRPAARHRRERAGPCRRRGRHPASRIGAAPAMQAAGVPGLRRPTTCSGRRRWSRKAFGESLRQPGRRTRASWCRCSARRARRTVEARAPRAADRARAQDAAGVLARPARGAAAPGVAPADAALVRRRPSSRAPPALARESLQVFAPLANRLGIWQIKWEMEDLSFRFLRAGRLQAASRACSTRSASSASRPCEQPRSGCEPSSRPQGIDGAGAGPAQAHLQHLEEDARQGARLRRRCSTCARCA